MNNPSSEGAGSKPMPKTLGRYEVRAKIGEGGMAAVYAGQQEGVGPDRLVALKVIRDEFSINPDFVNMFIDEARIVAQLWHPNIVKIYELGLSKEGGRLFIAMELLVGQSLLELWQARRERGQRLPYDLLAWIGARIADGLHHAHELRDERGKLQHVIHRDVNPSNVFLTYEGEVKIIDFGLAKAMNRISKTAAGVVKGKLAYLSPEQTVGREVDRRADVFALGTSLWELTTFRRLFRQADDIETLKRIHSAVVPDPMTIVKDYPPRLWAIIQRALARDRDLRYPTALDMGRDLDAFAKSMGREINAQTLAAIMQETFAKERARQTAWLHDASSPTAPPMATLKPPSMRAFDPALSLPPEARVPKEEHDLARPESARIAALPLPLTTPSRLAKEELEYRPALSSILPLSQRRLVAAVLLILLLVLGAVAAHYLFRH